jgi:integrase/recombinase XerC
MIVALVEPLSPEIIEFPWSSAPGDAIFHSMHQSRNTSPTTRSAFPLSDAELGALILSALDERERIIIELMGMSGLRVAEICTLEIARLDLVKRTAQVVGKGDKVRTVPLAPATAAKLKVFIGKRTRGYVFPGQKGLPHLSVRTVQYMVSHAGDRIGFKQKSPTLKHLNPHTFRHTAARRMKAAGFDYEEIARMLGHDDIAKTVMMYGTKTFKEIQDKAEATLFKLG